MQGGPSLRAIGLILVSVVCKTQCFVQDARFRLHYLKECEILLVCVFDSLPFNCNLLPNLIEVLAAIQLLDGLLEALQAKDQGGDVVQGSARCGASDDDLDSVCGCLMLVVLAGSSIG